MIPPALIPKPGTTSPLPRDPSIKSAAFFYHNGTASRKLMPCTGVKIINDSPDEIRVKLAGRKFYQVVPIAQVYHRDAPELHWRKVTEHKVNPAIPSLEPEHGNIYWHMDDGLFTFRGMLWASTKSRKVHTCWISHRELPKGSKIYRPITNNKHRMRRISATYAESLTRIEIK